MKKSILLIIVISLILFWGQDSFGEEISKCQVLHDNTSYLLTQDLIASGSCFPANIIDNVTLNCDGHTIIGDDTGKGIDSFAAKNFKIKNCSFKNFEYGTYLEYSEENLIEGNTFSNNQWGLFIYDFKKGIIKQNFANENKKSGFKLSDIGFGNVTENVANHNGGDGFSITTAQSSLFYDNFAEKNFESGFTFLFGGSSNVTNNIANENSKHGFLLDSVQRYSINDNTAIKNKDGLRIVSTLLSLLSGNLSKDNYQHGIILSISDYNSLNNNTSYNNNGNGISLDFSFDNTLRNNRVFENDEDGIFLSQGISSFNSNNLIKNNDSNLNRGFGINDLSNGSGTLGTANTFLENFCSSNGKGESKPTGLCEPKTAFYVISESIQKIENLKSQNSFPKGIGNNLLRNLETLNQNLEKENSRSACNHVNAMEKNVVAIKNKITSYQFKELNNVFHDLKLSLHCSG